MDSFPQRKRLHHDAPSWVPDGEVYFITLCCQKRGGEQLTRPEVSTKLLASVEKLHNAHTWWCHLCLLMPDHLHALLSFPPDQAMRQRISRFKGYQALTLGIQWQSGFFDHRIRNDKEFILKADYIRQNPIRAVLCKQPQDWPHQWPRPNIEPAAHPSGQGESEQR